MVDEAQPSTTPTLTISSVCAVLRLNRPEQHNRIELEDIAILSELLTRVERDSDVRVLVLTAGGPTFCSGYDIGALAKGLATDGHPGGESSFADLVDRLEDLRVPTICALQGSVYGGGTDIALACDFRIGARGIRMLMSASRLGVQYYYGGLRRYVERLGLGPAKRLFLSAQPVDANEMLRIGFLDEVVLEERLVSRVDEVASGLAAQAPRAVQGMKAALNRVARGAAVPAEIDAAWLASLRSADVAEGLAAWAEGRLPAFRRG
jgi:enoyl-CoA hydratase